MTRALVAARVCLAARCLWCCPVCLAIPHRVIELPNGNGSIPVLGLGTADAGASRPPFTCADSVEAALSAGYRHIDTAVFYQNHGDIAEGIRRSGVPREDIWITTKIPVHGEMIKQVGSLGANTTVSYLEGALAGLRTDYVDLVLLHFPGPDGTGIQVQETAGIEVEGDVGKAYQVRKEVWRALEEQVALGRARNIGVSNFLVDHLEEMRRYARRMPAVNQLELHPYLPQKDVRDWCSRHGVVVAAFGSVMQDIYPDLLGEPVVGQIAERHGATAAQVALAWALHKGIVVLPKSSKRHRMEENAGAVGLALRDEEIQELDGLDCATNALCRFPTRCGSRCRRGTYYWDPSLVPTLEAALEGEL